MEFLNYFGAIFTLCFGIWSAIQPHRVAKVLGLQLPRPRSIGEIRATYGGLMIALGAYACYASSTAVFQALGFAYLGTAILRTTSFFLDESYSKTSLRFVVLEVVIGGCLLVG